MKPLAEDSQLINWFILEQGLLESIKVGVDENHHISEFKKKCIIKHSNIKTEQVYKGTNFSDLQTRGIKKPIAGGSFARIDDLEICYIDNNNPEFKGRIELIVDNPEFKIILLPFAKNLKKGEQFSLSYEDRWPGAMLLGTDCIVFAEHLLFSHGMNKIEGEILCDTDMSRVSAYSLNTITHSINLEDSQPEIDPDDRRACRWVKLNPTADSIYIIMFTRSLDRHVESYSEEIEVLEGGLSELERAISNQLSVSPTKLLEERENIEEKLKDARALAAKEAAALMVEVAGGLEFLEDKESIIEQISTKFQTHNNRPTKEKISDFLYQLGNVRHMELTLRLLQEIEYIDDGIVVDIFRKFYADKLTDEERGQAVFSSLGGLQDSSVLVCYICSKALSEEEKRDIKFMELQTAMRIREPEETILIFLDDNIGSGKQSIQIFLQWLGLRKGKSPYVQKLETKEIRWLLNTSLWYFPLIGFEEGMGNLQKELKHHGLNITIHPAIKTREDVHCFDPESLIFEEAEDRDEAREMARAIGYELLQDKEWPEEKKMERSLGYGNSQKLYVFAWNTPTCTLPMFWKRGKYQGRDWVPLFPRRG